MSLYKLEVPVRVDAEVIAEVHIEDMCAKLNEVPIQSRWNCIAKILRETILDPELEPSQKQVIKDWLEARLAQIKSSS